MRSTYKKLGIIMIIMASLVGCKSNPAINNQEEQTVIKETSDNEIQYVPLTEEEKNFSELYAISDKNIFGSNLMKKYEIGMHSSEYIVKLNVEYLGETKVIDYMELPASLTKTILYVTMDNYNYLSALFNGNELLSKGDFDLKTLNKEGKTFFWNTCKSDVNELIGNSYTLEDNLILYKDVLSVAFKEDKKKENIIISLVLEEK